MRTPATALGILCVLALAIPAEAQHCTGAPSFQNQPYQVGVAAAFTEGGEGLGGSFGVGGESLFGGGIVSVLNFDELDATATQATAFGGAEFVANEARRVFVCPTAQVSFGAGPDIGPVDVSSFGIQAGGDVGVVAAQTDTLMVIPTFGLAAVYTRVSADAGPLDTTESDGSGVASVGVGFVFGGRTGVRPALLIPFSAGNSDPTFNLTFTFNFGG